MRSVASPFRTPRGITFSFTLPYTCSTSAGVYDSADRLIRTLWRGESTAPGAHTRKWDQKDDAGVTVAAGAYTIKLAHSNVVYEWDGCIGNSSYGSDIKKMHTLFNPPTCIVAAAGKVYYTGGYNEAQPSFAGFKDATPKINDQAPVYTDPFTVPSQFDVDQTRLYFVSYGGFGNTKSFVFALDLATGARSGFSAGTYLCLNYMDPPTNSVCYWDQNYSVNRSGVGGAISIKNDLTNVPSGIAVQRNGNVLAVAYPDESLIKLFHKTTGAQIGSITVTMLQNPATYTDGSGNQQISSMRTNQIAMAADGSLWVITGTNTVVKYTNLDTTPVAAEPVLISTINPLAIAVDPNNGNSIWVVDGDTNQQVKNFNGGGTLLRTIGQVGGSLDTSLITGDTFNFYNGTDKQQSAIAVDTFGNVWVADTANGRTLKFAPGNPQAVDDIQYRGISYCAAVDPGNPTRVFSNFMEYSVDYSKPLTDPTSWAMTHNWLSVLPSPYREFITNPTGFSGFTTVRTLPNGRTYALAHINNQELMFELTPDNQLRACPPLRVGASFSNANPFGAGTLNGGDTALVFYENGDLGYASNLYPTQEVKRLLLAGFDGSNNPIWVSSPVKLASIPLYAVDYPKTPQYNWGWSGVIGPRFPMTTTNVIVYFNNSASGDGMHLGGVDLGGTAFKWQASPAGALDFKGQYQTDTYGVGLQYGGNVVYTVDRNIFYGYHGEFYRDANNNRVGQACQFMHFYDNGLFIGQFGVPNTQTNGRQKGAIGNAFCWNIVSHNNYAYVYSNDESTFGGVTRWKISGLGSVVEMSALCDTGNSAVLT